MNYREIRLDKIKGYAELTSFAKKVFEDVYKKHNSIVGIDYKKNWEPIIIKEHKDWLEVHFINGEWLHYYFNGTWG